MPILSQSRRVVALATALALVSSAVPALFPAVAVAADIRTANGIVTLDSPARIAVMDVAAVDTLAALGIAPAGAPANLYVAYLADIGAATPDIGTLFEPDMEALAALNPDLIVVGGRSVAQADALKQLAPVIDMSIGADVLGDARTRITAYGALLGKEDRAAEMVADLDARLARLTEAGRTHAGQGAGKALVVMTNGPKMSAYGQGSRFGWILDATGLTEASPELKVDTHGAAISHEFIAQTNPDWLFVIDRSAAVGEKGETAKAVLDTPLVQGTNAWKNGRVVYLDPTPLYIAGGGYTAMTRAIDQLTEALGK